MLPVQLTQKSCLRRRQSGRPQRAIKVQNSQLHPTPLKQRSPSFAQSEAVTAMNRRGIDIPRQMAPGRRPAIDVSDSDDSVLSIGLTLASNSSDDSDVENDDVSDSDYTGNSDSPGYIPVSRHPVDSADVTAWDDELPGGGVLISVYTPRRTRQWIAAHSQDNLITRLRAHGFSGPLPYQLSPGQEALVLFGQRKPGVHELLRNLATASGFPVLIQPPEEDPLIVNAGPKALEAAQTGGGEPSQADSVHRTFGPSTTTSQQKKKKVVWNPKEHTANIEVGLKDEVGNVERVRLYMKFKFLRDDQAKAPRDCVASTNVKLQLNENFYLLDRSYSNMGFVVHRPNSISKCSLFIPPEYRKPQYTSKRTKEQNQSTTQGASLNASSQPCATLKLDKTRGSKTAEEQMDQKAKPTCYVQKSPGAEWNKHETPLLQKDFRSWDITWYPERDRPPDTLHEVMFSVDLELDLKPSSATHKSGIPNDIGCVLRNQVMVWLGAPGGYKEWQDSDDDVRSQSRHGVMLVVSTYIPNAFTDDVLELDESIQLDLRGDADKITRLLTSPPDAQDEKGNNYLAVARLTGVEDDDGNRRLSLFKKVFSQFRRPQPAMPKLLELPLYEVIIPGERSAREWMSPLWPSMDKELRQPELPGGATHCRTIAWNRKPADVQNIYTELSATPATQPGASASTVQSISQGAESSGIGRSVDTHITTPADSDSTSRDVPVTAGVQGGPQRKK
ncbi:hypothetical protein GGX14DRAFT_581387 [Mycena pura]|uniref:Uncharacterized protein n=1 Tax=Mycena pura TaxID=153505 RepID=A0AAD6YU62_9AGAR|nr:hypothetical protein GGX14DRAFT_581387 [Mycena pura]